MCRGRFTGLGDRRFGRFAADEKRAADSAAGRKEENLCLHEDIISSPIQALITRKKSRTGLHRIAYASEVLCRLKRITTTKPLPQQAFLPRVATLCGMDYARILHDIHDYLHA